ncbi:MAG: hypothetical protein AAFO89_07610, partial [Planctomycetota bacterium]
GLETGIMWEYLGGQLRPATLSDEDISNFLASGSSSFETGLASNYRCPEHRNQDINTVNGPTEILTSYMFNGALRGYGDVDVKVATRITDHRPDDVLMWETDDDPATTPAQAAQIWNDGAFRPDEGQTDRHGEGANVVRFDGSTEFFSQQKFDREAEIDVPKAEQRRSQLWANPTTKDGRGKPNNGR